MQQGSQGSSDFTFAGTWRAQAPLPCRIPGELRTPHPCRNHKVLATLAQMTISHLRPPYPDCPLTAQCLHVLKHSWDQTSRPVSCVGSRKSLPMVHGTPLLPVGHRTLLLPCGQRSVGLVVQATVASAIPASPAHFSEPPGPDTGLSTDHSRRCHKTPYLPG